MKKVLILGMIAVIVLGVGTIVLLGNRTETATLAVKGMHCTDCAKEVQEALMKIEGVKKASVDYEKGEATVEYKRSRVTPVVLKTTLATLEQKMDQEKKAKEGCEGKPEAGCCGEKSDSKKI
jgi:Cu+-exporting ATPase